MADIRILQDVDTGEDFYPATHEEAIVDDNGDKVIEKLKSDLSNNVFNLLSIHDVKNFGCDNTNYLTFEQGTIFEGIENSNKSRVRSNFFLVNKNTHITVNKGFRLGCAIYDLNKKYKHSTDLTSPYLYLTSHVIFGEICFVRIVVCKEDVTQTITPDEVNGQVSIYTKNPIIQSVDEISFKMGNYWYDSCNSVNNRIHSDMIRIPKNTKLTSHQKFNGNVFLDDTNTTTNNMVIGWVNEYYFEEESLLRLVMANNDDSEISDIETLKRSLDITVVTPESINELKEPILFKTVPCDTVGTLANGIHYSNSQRAHTDFIKVTKGMSINVDGYKYGVHFYDNATEETFYKSTNWISPKWFTFDEDCYIRVVCSHYFDNEMQSDEATVKLAWYTVKMKSERPFGVVAHRGLTATATENTLEAFKEAVKAGFKYIETDLWWTSDELPVLNHDGTHEGVNISSLTLAEWQVRGLCPLVDYLTVCKGNGVTPIIEFKAQMTNARAEYLYNLLANMGMLDVIFLAFNTANLMHMVNKHPFDIMWARDYGTVPTLESIEQFKKAFKHGNNVYWTLFGADFNESYYELFRNSGVKLLYGSANDVETFYRWVGYSDMIMTDKLQLPIL